MSNEYPHTDSSGLVGRCVGCFHDFTTGPCGGCGAVDYPDERATPIPAFPAEPIPDTEPVSPTTTVREAVARILDPFAWKTTFDEHESELGQNDPIVVMRHQSLRTANDAITAILDYLVTAAREKAQAYGGGVDYLANSKMWALVEQWLAATLTPDTPTSAPVAIPGDAPPFGDAEVEALARHLYTEHAIRPSDRPLESWGHLPPPVQATWHAASRDMLAAAFGIAAKGDRG